MGLSLSKLAETYAPSRPNRVSHRSSYHSPSTSKQQSRPSSSRSNPQPPTSPGHHRGHRPYPLRSSSSPHRTPPRPQPRPTRSYGNDGGSPTPVSRQSRRGGAPKEPFTPLPPIMIRPTDSAESDHHDVHYPRSMSSGPKSRSSVSTWSGILPSAPIPPNWDRSFYSGISPRVVQNEKQHQARRLNERGGKENKMPANPVKRKTFRYQSPDHRDKPIVKERWVYVSDTVPSPETVEILVDDTQARQSQTNSDRGRRSPGRKEERTYFIDPFTGERLVEVRPHL